MKKGKSILSLILVIAVTALFGMTCVLGLDLKGMGAARTSILVLTWKVESALHIR